MTIEDEELGPAVGRMLVTVFEAIESWSRREQASREIPIRHPVLEKVFKVPVPLPLISNVVVRKELDGETIAWFDVCGRKYTFKREYLVDGVSLASLPDPLASVQNFIASSRGSFVTRLRLLDEGERVLFMGANPGEVEAFAPGRWMEDFLRLFEAIAKQAHEEAAETMLKICRLGYWTGRESE
jgi:hypothetical protein